MNTLQDRIAEIMKATGLTVGELASIAGVSSSAVTQWKDGPTKSLKIGPATKLAIRTGYKPMWISTGELPKGQPVKAPAAAGLQQSDTTLATAGQLHCSLRPILAWEHLDDLPEGEFVLIPRLDIHLSVGDGREQMKIVFVEQQPQAFRADWIRRKRLKPQKLASMTAEGDSMEERIQHGDALVVDTSQTDVLDGKVYAIWYDGGERVKRLYRLPGGGLRIKSDNQRHPTIEVPASEASHVRIIGRVVHISGEGGL